jgi:hypothetical protein
VVAGPEEVVVPAGKYTAVRVDEAIALGNKKLTCTTWYAEGVGVVKKVHPDKSVQVLRLFTPGKA